jgi:hypothetical protein
MSITLNNRVVEDIQIDGVDTSDYPDFTDAFIGSAVFEDGTPLTDAELEQLAEENCGLTNELAHESLY